MLHSGDAGKIGDTNSPFLFCSWNQLSCDLRLLRTGRTDRKHHQAKRIIHPNYYLIDAKTLIKISKIINYKKPCRSTSRSPVYYVFKLNWVCVVAACVSVQPPVKNFHQTFLELFPTRLKAAWRRLQWPIVKRLSSSLSQWEATRSACQSQVRVDGRKKSGWKGPETGESPGWWQSYAEEKHRACGCSRNFPRLLPRGCDQEPTLEGRKVKRQQRCTEGVA